MTVGTFIARWWWHNTLSACNGENPLPTGTFSDPHYISSLLLYMCTASLHLDFMFTSSSMRGSPPISNGASLKLIPTRNTARHFIHVRDSKYIAHVCIPLFTAASKTSFPLNCSPYRHLRSSHITSEHREGAPIHGTCR